MIRTLSIIALFQFLAITVNAQLKFYSDTAILLNVQKNNTIHKLKDTIFNNSNAPITITWNKFSDQIPIGWDLVALCDNKQCYLDNNMEHSLMIPAQSAGIIYTDIKAAPNASGCAIVFIAVKWGDSSKMLTYVHTVDAAAINCLFAVPNSISNAVLGSNLNKVYPTVVKDKLFIDNFSANTVRIYDITSNLIYCGTLFKGINQIDIPNEIAGNQMMIVQLFDASQKLIQSNKIVR